MKLTKREKILGLILGSLIFIWLYITFVFTPLNNKISTMKNDATFMEAQVEISKDMIRNINEKEKQLIEVTNRVRQMAKPLFSSMYQEKIIYILSQLIDNNDISIKQMSFNYDIFAESDQGEEISKVDPANTLEIDGLQGMEIDIPFLSNYDNLNKFLSEIRAYDKYINIVSLKIGETSPEVLSGNITLRFYAYPVILANTDDGVVINSDENDYLVNNPFNVFQDTSDGNLELEASESPLGGVTLIVEDEFILYDNFELVHSAIASINRTKVETYKDNDSKEGTFSNFIGFAFPKTINTKELFLDINPNQKSIQNKFSAGRIDVKSYGTSDTQVFISYYNNKGVLKETLIFSSIDWIGWKSGEFVIESIDYPITFKNIVFKSDKTDYVDEKYNIDNFTLSYEVDYEKYDSNINDSFVEHKVLSGDTLYSISKKYYGTGSKVDVIKKYNSLSGNNIKVGKILIIPNDIK